MSRRILVNLGVFVLLFLLLCFWAVRNIIRFDFIERPYTVVAEFATSPGLRADFEVSYLGVRVGNVGAVRLAGDRVRVNLKIDRGIEIPADVTAAVRRKSAVGEPYVDLTPTPEAVVAASAGSAQDVELLEGGDVIALERTSTPLSYSELFGALDDLVSAVPTADLTTLIHELSVGLEGRGPSLRNLLTGAHDLTETLAANSDLLDQLAGDLTRLTHTFAEHGEALGSSFDNLAVLSETLASSRADVEALLERAPRFADQVANLLGQSGGNLGCLLDSLGVVTSRLATPTHLEELRRLFELAGPAGVAYSSTRFEGPDGPYQSAPFFFNAGAAGVPFYPAALPLPTAPVVPGCGAAGPAVPGVEATAPTAVEAAPATPTEEATPAVVPDRVETVAEAQESSDEKVGGSGTDWVLAGLAVLVLLALIAALRPWRLVGIGRRDKQTSTGPEAIDQEPAESELVAADQTGEP